MLNYVYSPFRLIFFQFGFVNKIRLSNIPIIFIFGKISFFLLFILAIFQVVYIEEIANFLPINQGNIENILFLTLPS